MAQVQLLVVAFAFANSPASAQENAASPGGPPGHDAATSFDPRMRWLFDSQIGTYEALGYRLPHLAFGVSLEKPIPRRFELRASVSDSPDRKLVNNSGNTLSTSVGGIGWVRRNLGAYTSVSYSHLWTSQFNKSGWAPHPGGVFRMSLLGVPTRMYVAYLLPTGRINRKGVESSRIQGVEYTIDTREANLGPLTLRFGVDLNVYHFLEQGNPVCDGTFPGPVTCPRKGHFATTMAITFRFESLRNAADTMF